MTKLKTLFTIALVTLTTLALSTAASAGPGKFNAAEITRTTTENQIRNLLEPLLAKYCRDECKLLSVSATVDVAVPEELAPGFDDLTPANTLSLAASSARVKILVDEKVGPVSRGRLVDMIQQYLDTLEFQVKLDVQYKPFPQPFGSDAKISDLRDRVSKQFRNTIQEIFQQFCPDNCLLGDFNLKAEAVNAEEAQFGSSTEFVQDGALALKIREISATLILDEELPPEERANILELAKLKTNYLKNVTLNAMPIKFPRPDKTAISGAREKALQAKQKTSESNSASTTAKTENNANTNASTTAKTENISNNNNNEKNERSEVIKRTEIIERVENGDALKEEFKQMRVFGLIFACSVISLLLFLAVAGFRPRTSSGPSGGSVHRVIQSLAADPISSNAPSTYRAPDPVAPHEELRVPALSKRYEIERLVEELTAIFAQQPKVAKQVFTRILTEEGIETTAEYIHIFGEGIVLDMVRDPSLQTDVIGLMEFYSKNTIEITDDEKLELLRKLHNRTIAGKLTVLGNRSSSMFDFLTEMDGPQIIEMLRGESDTLKSIVLTQCDPQKRAAVYAQLDDKTRLKLLTELSRIDYLPKDFIYNVASALKRKRRDNPRLNTEALPGSEVLVGLLERTSAEMQRTVIRNLEMASPESARTVKSKLVSIETLRFLRDSQLLEVVLNLKHDELLIFLKGASAEVRNAVFSKSPKELVFELEEELGGLGTISREDYQGVERKILNRMKMMATEGLVNLVETNDRLFSETKGGSGFVEAGPNAGGRGAQSGSSRKVA
ncbi:FliG C-terminal domain-containing protein [Bdellovibrionota bacterium FG-2]